MSELAPGGAPPPPIPQWYYRRGVAPPGAATARDPIAGGRWVPGPRSRPGWAAPAAGLLGAVCVAAGLVLWLTSAAPGPASAGHGAASAALPAVPPSAPPPPVARAVAGATPTPSPVPARRPAPAAAPAAARTTPPTVASPFPSTGRPPTASPSPSGRDLCGAPANPWGYNFCDGSTITSPPAVFCLYFDCVDSFWAGHGYVIECHDRTFSRLGGTRGSCSSHGGDPRTLYR